MSDTMNAPALGPDLVARCLGYLPQMLDGALTTLWISALAVVFGFFGGVFLHLVESGGGRVASRVARAYISVVRGTPVLAQLLVCYFIPSAMGLSWPGSMAAVIGLALNTAAYQSQILGAGFRAIPAGQIEAARTFNLTRSQTLWRIEVPQVAALTSPALVSEVIDVVKASAVVSVITVTDLTRVGQQLASATYRPLEVYSMAALGYLVITSLVSVAGAAWARRMARRS
ncbi:ABC transporter permease [Pandoraea captiosa]|uniref:ABC transporter permease n=2 Tax=Pandoraea captiosa TaxID=2508302 RepID=A0A5E5AQ39_9BURK|nr:ABC transporter permease [Pandoraea captiosa]